MASTEKILGWQATDKNVIVTFDQPIAPEREASVTVEYRAQPTRGLYFRTPEMGYKPEDMHVWTQAEFLRLLLHCRERYDEACDIEAAARRSLEFVVVLSKGGCLP